MGQRQFTSIAVCAAITSLQHAHSFCPPRHDASRVGAVIPVIPIYSQSIGLSSTSNGIVISAPAVALLICSRFSANYADVARKPAMMLGMLCIAISDLGTGFANSLPSLLVARLGLGLGRGVSEAGERGMLADLLNRAPED
ncbi:hypothetical protein ACHAXN_009177 [Cyclotella atomus]